MSTSIRVAVVGVGSCASSLIQTICAARSGAELLTAGVAYSRIGGRCISDIEVVAGFDVDRNKVGKDVAIAMREPPNRARIYYDVAMLGVEVAAGPVLDGIDGPLATWVVPHSACREAGIKSVVETLREARVDVVVNFLPTGSAKAARLYAEAALEARAAFVNGMPEPIANDADFQARYLERGVPLLGDDTRSSLGASTVHMALLRLCLLRGAEIDRTFQLNVGGNSDFFNMMDPARSASKRRSKRAALERAGLSKEHLGSAGPNGYIEELGDEKNAFIEINGSMLLGSPFSLQVRLQVQDSPNAAATIVDAIRCAHLARERCRGGVVSEVLPILFKRPPGPTVTDAEADAAFRRFVI